MNQKPKKGMPKLNMKRFNMLSLGVVAVVLCAVVLGNNGIDGLVARWRQLSAKWMLAAVACMGVYWLLEGIEVDQLTRCLYRGVPLRSSLRTAMIGQLYSALTPFSTGGQPIQLLYMQRDGLDAGGAASVLTIKSVTYQVGQMVLALVAIISSYAFFRATAAGFVWLSILGFLANSVVTGGMLMLAISPRMTRKLVGGVTFLLHKLHLIRDLEVTRQKTEAQIEIFHQSTHRFEKKIGAIVGVMLLTLLQLFSLYLVPYCIYRAFGLHEPVLVHMMAAVAYVSMVAAFVPLPGGSGGAEGGFVLFFSIFFGADVLLALLLWRLITYYLAIIIGAIVMMVSRKRQRACIRLPIE